MRRLFTLLGLAPIAAFAQQATGIAGTKLATAGPVPATNSGLNAGALFQMVLALAIVAVLLKTVLPKFAGKLGKKRVASSQGGIVIEESAQFAGGSLYIVSARGRSLLLGVSGQGVATLADLSEPLAAAPEPFEVALQVAETNPPQFHALAAIDHLTELASNHAIR